MTCTNMCFRLGLHVLVNRLQHLVDNLDVIGVDLERNFLEVGEVSMIQVDIGGHPPIPLTQ
jgi:hypothetical protein